MAYNVLKGIVEGSVDQYGDQEIDGVKVFKSTISASVFYDTDAQSPCATLKDVVINELEGGMKNALFTYQGKGKAKSEHNLTFNGELLSTKKIRAERFIGGAQQLTQIPSDQFSDPIPARFLKLGPGLHNVRNNLQVKAKQGLETDEAGLKVALAPKRGLSFVNRELALDPQNTPTITEGAQNLTDKDLLMVYDVSRRDVRQTTLANLFSAYINGKVPHAEGTTGCIQLKGKKEFDSSSDLVFDSRDKTLRVQGNTYTETLKVAGKMACKGAVYQNIKTVTKPVYKVDDADHTVLIDTSDHKITVTLPPACNHEGRVLILKKINTLKYKLNSNVLIVEVEEGEIDFKKSIQLKFTYSTLTLQSDGEKWWIVGRTGS